MIPSQERILKLCIEQGTSISKLEKDLGFGNGYIKTKREREFPADRLSKIANALGVTTDYLTYGEDNHYQRANRRFLISQLEVIDEELGIKKPAADDGNGYDSNLNTISDKDKRLLDFLHSLPPEKLKAVLISQDAPEDLL